MLALWWLGAPVEMVLGRVRYLGLYIVSGLAGAAGALIANPHAVTVGASGAIFGLLGAGLILEYQATGSLAGNYLTLIVINLAISFAVPGHLVRRPHRRPHRRHRRHRSPSSRSAAAGSSGRCRSVRHRRARRDRGGGRPDLLLEGPRVWHSPARAPGASPHRRRARTRSGRRRGRGRRSTSGSPATSPRFQQLTGPALRRPPGVPRLGPGARLGLAVQGSPPHVRADPDAPHRHDRQAAQQGRGDHAAGDRRGPRRRVLLRPEQRDQRRSGSSSTSGRWPR